VHILIVGGTRVDRLRHAASLAGSASNIVRLDDVERAFPDKQIRGTRFVLTQSTYVMQALVDSLAPGHIVIATADRAALERDAPEAFDARGPWRGFDIREAPVTHGGSPLSEVVNSGGEPCAPFRVPPIVRTDPAALALLVHAFETASASERFALCRDAVSRDPDSALVWLAAASASRESDDMAAARDALDRAATLAPTWAAVHYEDGKFWLGYDDMARARDSFQRAADLMPTFSAAFSNLGATLGELDEPDMALAAFSRALTHDPHGFQIMNNIGVTTRELGRLDESEAAFRRVVETAPGFVFGYYNLGHTLFLAGKYTDALAAYEQGQRRDPEKNRRQGCRLAMMRFATGDIEGATRDLWHFAGETAGAEREDLLLEAYEIGCALIAAHTNLEAGGPLIAQIAAALTSDDQPTND
jgi:Tfp pilus assembly protein PilF